MIQKRDKGLAVVWILFFLIQPIAVSYAVGVVTDWSTSTEVDYNPTTYFDDYIDETYGTNATTTYYETQTVTFDNDTGEAIVPSLVFDTVASKTSQNVRFYLNSSFLNGIALTKVVIKILYVGTGNVTDMEIRDQDSSPSVILYKHSVTVPTGQIASNQSITWTLESFKANQLKSIDKMGVIFTFGDTSNWPSSTDYFSLDIEFYTSTILVSAEMIMQYIAGALILIDFIAILAITNVWNPQKGKKKGK